jgi:poly(3-hydroxybutyrate) depolymerase
MMSRRRTQLTHCLLPLLGTGLVVLAGCVTTPWHSGDGRITTGKLDFQREAVSGRTYHLYIPRNYTPDRFWPLVITAQGTFPFDQALGQRDRWVNVAEKEGLIICSPDFDSANGLMSVPSDKTPPELERDETATLRILHELKLRYKIDPDAIMISAWSGGGFPAHFIALHHPDLFRCVVGRTANFSPYLADDSFAERARHLNVYLFLGSIDLPGFDQMHQTAAKWFTAHKFPNFSMKTIPGGHDSNETEAARYFVDLIRHWPVVRLKAAALSTRNPRLVRFQADVRDADGPPENVSVLWNFGDGTSASGRQVDHTFPKAGLYKVFVTAIDPDGHHQYAQQWYNVP